MPLLDNTRHELFAQHVAAGKTLTAAYAACYPGTTDKAARANGARLLANDSVKQRVDELKDELAAASFITRQHLIAKHWTIFNTPIGSIDRNSELAQEWSETQGEQSSSVRLRMVDKMSALKEIAKLCGFYEPEKLEVTAKGVPAATVKEFMKQRRRSK